MYPPEKQHTHSNQRVGQQSANGHHVNQRFEVKQESHDGYSKQEKNTINTNTFTIKRTFIRNRIMSDYWSNHFHKINENIDLHPHTKVQQWYSCNYNWKTSCCFFFRCIIQQTHVYMNKCKSNFMQTCFHNKKSGMFPWADSCNHLHTKCRLMWDTLWCSLSCISAPDSRLELISAAQFKHRAVVCPLPLTTLLYNSPVPFYQLLSTRPVFWLWGGWCAGSLPAFTPWSTLLHHCGKLRS